jgi:hypothetical protein
MDTLPLLTQNLILHLNPFKVPMIWGAWRANPKALESKMTDIIIPDFNDGLTKRLLGFNEPDSWKQAAMPVKTALKFWPELVVQGMPLASPATVNPTNAWMQEFCAAVDKRHWPMDYIAVHWYGWANAEEFKDRMREIYEFHGSNRPLLITEMGPADWQASSAETNRITRDEVLAFAQEVLPWMEADEQDWIAGYAWFSFKTSSRAGTSSALFEEDGSMTPLGEYYARVCPNFV